MYARVLHCSNNARLLSAIISKLRFEEDLMLAKDIGSNAFRFSLEWSRVEPKQGQIDKLAIARFHQIIDCIRRCAASTIPKSADVCRW